MGTLLIVIFFFLGFLSFVWLFRMNDLNTPFFWNEFNINDKEARIPHVTSFALSAVIVYIIWIAGFKEADRNAVTTYEALIFKKETLEKELVDIIPNSKTSVLKAESLYTISKTLQDTKKSYENKLKSVKNIEFEFYLSFTLICVLTVIIYSVYPLIYRFSTKLTNPHRVIEDFLFWKTGDLIKVWLNTGETITLNYIAATKRSLIGQNRETGNCCIFKTKEIKETVNVTLKPDHVLKERAKNVEDCEEYMRFIQSLKYGND